MSGAITAGDHCDQQQAGTHFQAGDRQRIGIADEAFVETGEDRYQQRAEHADQQHPMRMLVGVPPTTSATPGIAATSEQQLAHVEATADQERLDEGEEHRRQRQAGGGDRGVRQANRAVEREPMKRDHQADAGVGRNQSAAAGRKPAPEARHHSTSAPATEHQCATRPATASPMEISLPRMAVNPHRMTQK